VRLYRTRQRCITEARKPLRSCVHRAKTREAGRCPSLARRRKRRAGEKRTAPGGGLSQAAFLVGPILFALLAPCQVGASTLENGRLLVATPSEASSLCAVKCCWRGGTPRPIRVDERPQEARIHELEVAEPTSPGQALGMSALPRDAPSRYGTLRFDHIGARGGGQHRISAVAH
jgi:hypothetical protein